MKKNLEKIEFETFRQIGGFEISNLKRDEPSCVNFLSYKKFKVTIEPIQESNEVYIQRLTTMLAEGGLGYSSSSKIKDEIAKLKAQLL